MRMCAIKKKVRDWGGRRPGGRGICFRSKIQERKHLTVRKGGGGGEQLRLCRHILISMGGKRITRSRNGRRGKKKKGGIRPIAPLEKEITNHGPEEEGTHTQVMKGVPKFGFAGGT